MGQVGPVDADSGLLALEHIYTDFGEFCGQRGTVSEADTRSKVIDRILRDALGWPEAALRRETPLVGGFVDYVLSRAGRATLVIEAKRDGTTFSVPHNIARRRRHKLNGAIRTSGELYSAIEQAQRYCAEIGIRYAVVTNGYAWVIFRAHREDIPWRQGYALIYPTPGFIMSNFVEFWNLLSPDSVSNGSLERAFASEVTTPQPQFRVLAELRNADAPLLRNRLHQPLGAFVEAVFRDIANSDQREQLDACYVYDRSLQIIDRDLGMVVVDSIPRFAIMDGASPIVQGQRDAGEFGAEVVGAASSQGGSVFLLLGGIGSGKTTFVKRFVHFVGADSLNTAAVWFYLDLLAAPVDAANLEIHVARSILTDIRARYAEMGLETYETLKQAFAPEIAVLEQTVLSRERLGETEYERRLANRLDQWMNEPLTYVPRLMSVARAKGYGAVICIDNVDQLPAAYQTQIFLLAQRVATEMGAVTIVALREESYYSANVQRTFTAYNNRSFHIASPSFDRLIFLRMRYMEGLLKLPTERRREILKTAIDIEDAAVVRFFDIIQQSVFQGNRNISRFIEALAFGNMREALDMFATFLYSGATDVDKMLGIYERQGSYFVAFHEFAKAVILGDRRHYRESESRILNVFDRGTEGLSSHFTLLRLVHLLLAHSQSVTSEGRGFVRLDEVVGAFADCFDDEQDIVHAANRAVRRQLVQVDTRSTESIDGASWIRASSGGWYYAKFLANSFAYLDLMLEDTAFDDRDVAKALVKMSEPVDTIADSPQTRLPKTELRFARVDYFLDYLRRREDQERGAHELAKRSDVLGRPIMIPIREQYDREKTFVRSRLGRNAENVPEQLPLDPTVVDADRELAALVAAGIASSEDPQAGLG